MVNFILNVGTGLIFMAIASVVSWVAGWDIPTGALIAIGIASAIFYGVFDPIGD